MRSTRAKVRRDDCAHCTGDSNVRREKFSYIRSTAYHDGLSRRPMPTGQLVVEHRIGCRPPSRTGSPPRRAPMQVFCSALIQEMTLNCVPDVAAESERERTAAAIGLELIVMGARPPSDRHAARGQSPPRAAKDTPKSSRFAQPRSRGIAQVKVAHCSDADRTLCIVTLISIGPAPRQRVFGDADRPSFFPTFPVEITRPPSG